MLKQPLLSRMFKSLGTASTSDKQTTTEALREKEVDSKADSAVTDSAVTDGAVTDSAVTESSEALPVPQKNTATQDAKVALLDKPEAGSKTKLQTEATVVLPETSEKKSLKKKTLEENSEKATDKDSKDLEDKSSTKKGQKKLSRKTILRSMLACGLLASAGGFAVTRMAPNQLRALLSPTAKAVPISLPGDPTAESIINTGDLFLTNQILYRKLEAIAGVSLTKPASPTPLPTSTTAAKPNAAKADTEPSTNGKPTDSKTNSTAESGPAISKPVETNPDVQVVAAAPPAPAIAPVEFTGTTIDNVLEMRVSLARDVPAIGFATSGNGLITDLDGNALKELSPEQGVTAEISNGITVDGETMPAAFWVYADDGGYVAVGDSWYRGRVLIALRERGLIAVNHVFLGDYLYSVVGSEMSPGWSIESLKAQAIAARSYALTHNIHPASEEYFDLDNTQRFQAYKGINREANTTQAAVQATAGEFISHEGGIVESLYAASQAIVDDAHKGSGMSQLGAKDLAEQGYSYQEILVHYYPGTALGRIETDPE